MSNTFLISLIIPIKIIFIYLIVSYFRNKKIKEKKQSAEAVERMQIREYGKKINDETRSRRSK